MKEQILFDEHINRAIKEMQKHLKCQSAQAVIKPSVPWCRNAVVRPCLQVPCPHFLWTLPGIVIPSPPWVSHSNAWQAFLWKKIPSIPSKPPLVQLEAVSYCLVACDLGEETNLHLATTSSQGVMIRFPLSLLFLQTEHSQLLLIRLEVQTSPWLRCTLWTCSNTLTSFLLWGAQKLDKEFMVCLHQCWAQDLSIE